MTPCIITDCSAEQFEALKPIIRRTNSDILERLGFDVEKELNDSFYNASIRKLIMHGTSSTPIGLHLSWPYTCLDGESAYWILLTFVGINERKIEFARQTKEAIKRLWDFERPEIKRAMSVIPTAFKQSIEWHRRVIGSKIVFTFNDHGHEFVMTEIRRAP